ncbi:MAG: hypothetical protein BGO77_06260 [Caedibacter sp. 37-49]|nr:MAG: hypothetical protein BGO77_06260 [Caedibacter sp. 37-49]
MLQKSHVKTKDTNMNDRPKLTIKKPLSLEKQTQISQALQSSGSYEPTKLSSKEQEYLKQKAQKKKKEGIKTALRWLQETYPECFNPQAPKPLKLKVEADLFAALPSDQSLSKVKIRQALEYHTKSIAYLKSLLNNTHRYDLQGHAVEEIYPAHKAWAQEKYEKTLKRIKDQSLKKKKTSSHR